MDSLKKGDNRHFHISNNAGEFFHLITHAPKRDQEVDGVDGVDDVDLIERRGTKFSPGMSCQLDHGW